MFLSGDSLSYRKKNAQTGSFLSLGSLEPLPVHLEHGFSWAKLLRGEHRRCSLLTYLGQNPAFPAFRTVGSMGQRAVHPKSQMGHLRSNSSDHLVLGPEGSCSVQLLGSIPPLTEKLKSKTASSPERCWNHILNFLQLEIPRNFKIPRLCLEFWSIVWG